MHVYRFRFVAACANDPPVRYSSIDTPTKHTKEVQSPGHTVLLMMEKETDIDESEPYKPKTARWSSRSLFHLRRVHLLSVRTHPLPSHLRSVFGVYT